MDNAEGVKLLQQVVLGLHMARVPLRLAVNDLCMALGEPEAVQDLDGVLRAWRRMTKGDVWPEARVGWPVPEEDRALAQSLGTTHITPNQKRVALAKALAAEHGRVTSTDLAQAAGCHNETARNTLLALARDGIMQAHGEYKLRYYVLAKGHRG